MTKEISQPGCGPEETAEQRLARRRNAVLVRGNREYRSGYMRAHNRGWLAEQFRALRGSMSQEDFGKLVGKSKTVISRLENPNYSGASTRTLYQIASALDIAVVIRLVDYETFLSFTNDMSDVARKPSAPSTGPVNPGSASNTDAAQERHLTPGEQSVMKRALRASGRSITGTGETEGDSSEGGDAADHA